MVGRARAWKKEPCDERNDCSDRCRVPARLAAGDRACPGRCRPGRLRYAGRSRGPGGQQGPGQQGHIFYYQYFDADHNTFGNISVFEFNPGSFSISKRIFASSAHWEPGLRQWVFEDGWTRTFKGDEISAYTPFVVSAFPEIQEKPGYFKTEEKLADEMSFRELANYIHTLRQSGFDTIRLRVELNRKLAYPLITLIMAILAIPFALSMGRKGSLAGIAVAIGVAIAYFVVDGTFQAMGDVNMLPAFLAAWSPDLVFALAGGYLLLRTST